MKRWIWGLAIVATVLVAALAAALVVLNSIDWSEYEEPIEQEVLNATGRVLDLGGKLRVRVVPTPSVDVSNVRFANADWGSRPDLAQLERLTVRLRLLPLLVGQVVVSRIELIGLDVLLETDAKGVGNWIFEPPTATTEPEETIESEEESGSVLSALLRRAVVRDAKLTYRDPSTGDSEWTIERLVANTRSASAPMVIELRGSAGEEDVELDATLEGMSELLAGGPLSLVAEARSAGATLELQGSVGAPLEGTGLDLDATFSGEKLSALSLLVGSALPDLGPYRVASHLAGGGDEYRLTNLEVALGGSEIRGEVVVALSGDRPRITATLESPGIDLADLSDEGEAPPAEPVATSAGGRLFPDDPLPTDALSSVDAALSLKVRTLLADTIQLDDISMLLELENGRLEVAPGTARLFGGQLDVNLTLDTSVDQPKLTARVDVEKLDAGALAQAQETRILEGGLLDLDLDVAGVGESIRAIMASLQGRIVVEMGAGTIRDQWAETLTSDLSSIVAGGGKTAPAELNCAVGDFTVTQGIARPNVLVVDTPALALFGDGQINLRDESLDLNFDRKARNISVTSILPPFKIGGTLSSPTPSLHPEALVGKVLDLASVVTGRGQGEVTESRTPERCRQLLARYEDASRGREVTKESAVKAAVGVAEQGKSAIGAIKGLLKR